MRFNREYAVNFLQIVRTVMLIGFMAEPEYMNW